MDYEEWKGQVPAAIQEDALWRFEAYRLALFFLQSARGDVK